MADRVLNIKGGFGPVRVCMTGFVSIADERKCERDLRALTALFAPTLRSLCVRSVGEIDDGAVAQIFTQPDYRDATITITTKFLASPEDERRGFLLHELVHHLVEPMSKHALRVFETTLKEDAPRFHKECEDEQRARVEQVVSDLTSIFAALLIKEAAS